MELPRNSSFSDLGLLFILMVAGTIRATPLKITALTSRNGYSVLECWQLAAIPADYLSAVNYNLGNTTDATWSRIEPRTTVGEAWAPHVQFTVVLNGLVRITAPAPVPTEANTSVCLVGSLAENHQRPATNLAYAMPGTVQSSLLIAADLKSTSINAGHFTEFPSDEPTILVQAPFANNTPPKHTVLHDGPCV